MSILDDLSQGLILNYVLDERGNVIPEPNFFKWSEFFNQIEKRIVGKNSYTFKGTTIDVSTVFLGMPHCYPFHQHKDGNAFFETMVFAPDDTLAKLIDMSESDTSSILAAMFGNDDIQVRYATRDEAVKGH